MQCCPRGYAVIVNMQHVEGMEQRRGSETDVKKLKALTEQLHYDVKILSDLTKPVSRPNSHLIQ